MEPIVFNDCFGWIHAAPGNETGLIVCNPYGHETLWSHVGLRRLAEHAAAAGIPALRFDYPGAGNSAGDENEPDRIDAWVEGIGHAIAALKRETGVTRIVLCGLRYGATLASLAAERYPGVDGLVLLEPVVTGKEYLRELAMIQRRWKNASEVSDAAKLASGTPEETVETFGFRLFGDTLAQMKAIDLSRRATLPAAHVLILDHAPLPSVKRLIAAYEAAGTDIEVQGFDEYLGLIGENEDRMPPRQAIAAITQWVTDHVRAPAQDVAVEASGPAPIMLKSALANGRARQEVRGTNFIETPVRFGDGRLFGVYCRPASGVLTEQAVLFPSTGANHHIGNGRLWVLHARRLAAQGIASLRMDVGVIGDGADVPESLTLLDLHCDNAVDDVSTGIDWLVAAGHARPTTVGICSGAYLSFHAAASNPNVAGVVMINQQIFQWNTKRHAPDGEAMGPTHAYLQSLKHWSEWKRMLTGQTRVFTILPVLGRRISEQWRERWKRVFSGKQQGTGMSMRDIVLSVEARGTRLTMLFGPEEVGLEEAALYFGRDFSWIRQSSGVALTLDPSVDHALFLYPARELMMDIVDRHLTAVATTLGQPQGQPQGQRNARSTDSTLVQSALLAQSITPVRLRVESVEMETVPTHKDERALNMTA